MSGGAYQILDEISKSRRKRKALIPIVALFKAERVLSMPSIFPFMDGVNQRSLADISKF